jgi:ergothioneine biosynthesis protein EgtB
LPEVLVEQYRRVRRLTDSLSRPLATEDMVVQSMPSASPTKWHLAHTTWFFETFVLTGNLPGYEQFDRAFGFLFNSYYNAVGPQYARPHRGVLSRPTVEAVREYRQYVDEAMGRLFSAGESPLPAELVPVIELGIHHEQQHQELLLTDIKHAFGSNPLRPVYVARDAGVVAPAPDLNWIEMEAGVQRIGHEIDAFSFDNETPGHRVFLEAFALADRLVTCDEYLAFIEDDGYRRPDLWLSAGWDVVRERGWQAPLYWERAEEDWQLMTLAGMRALEASEPVCHVSFYEADAYARWAGARLPTEFEWEAAARDNVPAGNFVESGRFHPASAPPSGDLPVPRQMFGDVWEWTGSQYRPYPGYEPPEGALGEYNGKFMSNQFVLRGGSCATPQTHIRTTYRNFFPPDARWQFSGIRLARDLGPEGPSSDA